MRRWNYRLRYAVVLPCSSVAQIVCPFCMPTVRLATTRLPWWSKAASWQALAAKPDWARPLCGHAVLSCRRSEGRRPGCCVMHLTEDIAAFLGLPTLDLSDECHSLTARLRSGSLSNTFMCPAALEHMWHRRSWSPWPGTRSSHAESSLDHFPLMVPWRADPRVQKP